MLGKFDVNQYLEKNSSLGLAIFSAYNIIMLAFVLNIFISIITEAFDKVRTDAKMNPDRQFNFWTHLKYKLSMLKNEAKPKYKDHLKVFPKRVDKLIDVVICC